MKKCDNCGAVQDDARTVCLDCGALLGRPMTDTEEAAHLSALEEKVEQMTDPSDDFAVPRRDKIMGVLALVGIAVLCVLLGVIGAVEDRYQPEYPAGTVLSDTGSSVVIFSPGGTITSFENPYAAEQDALERAALAVLCGIVCFTGAAFSLFFPRAVWYLETMRIRRWINHEPTPSYAWILTHRILQYVLFALGWVCVISAVWLIP